MNSNIINDEQEGFEMACFLVSAAEAVIVTAVEKAEEKKEALALETGSGNEEAPHIPLSRKLKWLTYMLWGGVILLAFEHLWHGEITPYFPFLTAMADPADMSAMLHEMATVGVCMALAITAVWAVICITAEAMVKRPEKAAVKETV